MKTIGKNAFDKCESLKKVSFADCSQLREIGEDAFKGCNNLVLTLPEGLTSIGEEWFKESGINEISIPASVRNIGKSAFN